MSRDKRAILVFYGVVLFLSLLIELLYIRTVITFLLVLLMWIPGIVGMICSRVFYGMEDSLGIASKVEPKYRILGILIPAVYLVGSYCIAWAVLGDPANGVESESLLRSVVGFLPGLLGSTLTAAGEEIGWRGFAFPVLERGFGTSKAVFINGFIWALWHVPLIIGGVYQSSVHPAYGIVSFMVMVMLIAVIFCWSRSVSGSVIPAILLHASHNHIDQRYLQPMSTDPRVPYFAGEQGMITIVIAAVIAAVIVKYWKK